MFFLPNDASQNISQKRIPRLSSEFRNYRLTLIATTILLLSAIASNSYWQPLAAPWREWVGFAPSDLPALQWQRLLTSLALTGGGWKFLTSLAMLIVCLGFCEHIYGTPAACRLFFLCHLTILTIISISVILLAEIHPSSSVDALMNGRDVGPSAGYYGCLGAILIQASRSIKQASFTILIVILLVRLSVSVGHLPSNPATVSADFAHLVALLFGATLAWLGHLKPRSTSTQPTDHIPNNG